ncbi:hypothetical protein RQP46_009963 [Phenoliferia psychrophenolica]
MLFSPSSAALVFALVSPIAAAVIPSTFDPAMVVKRTPAHLVKRDDYSDSAHCPGGCEFKLSLLAAAEPLAHASLLSSTDPDNCAASDTAGIVATVTDSVAVGNSYTETTTLTVGIDAEGFSAGVSQSWAESWTTTDTFGESQSITIGPQQNNINAYKNFFIAEGQLKINYGSAQDGHYIWLTTGLEVFTADPDSNDSYSANVGDCGGPVTKPNKGDMFYNNADYDNAKAGASSTYTYSDDS